MAEFATNFLAGFQGAKQNMRADQEMQNRNALLPLQKEQMQLRNDSMRQGMAIDAEKMALARREVAERTAEALKTEADAERTRATLEQGRQLLTAVAAGGPGADMAWREIAAGLGNPELELNPETFALAGEVAGGIEEGLLSAASVARFGAPEPEADSAKEQQIQRLMEARNLDRATAVGIVDGALVVSPLGEVVDKATGLPTNTPQENDPLSFGATVPDADYDTAFGGGGFARQVANTAADAIGAPLPAPETQTAVTALENVGLRTKTFLQSAFPGRASVQLMNELERVTAQPNRIFRGEQRSVDTLTQTSSLIQGLIEQEQRKIDNPRGYTAQMRAEAQSNIDQLGPLLADYRSILRQIDGGGQNRTSSGVTWSIEE